MAEQTLSDSAHLTRSDLVDDAVALNSLAQWVTEAKDVLDELRAISRADETFAALIKKFDIRIYSPEWHSVHEQGLAQVFAGIHEKLMAIKGEQA